MRLIDADRLLERLLCDFNVKWPHAGVIRKYILDTVETEEPITDPVKHGYWQLEYGEYGAMRCSSCLKECPLEKVPKPKYHREELLYIASDYCPWCGCKMDLKSEGTDE